MYIIYHCNPLEDADIIWVPIPNFQGRLLSLHSKNSFERIPVKVLIKKNSQAFGRISIVFSKCIIIIKCTAQAIVLLVKTLTYITRLFFDTYLLFIILYLKNAKLC